MTSVNVTETRNTVTVTTSGTTNTIQIATQGPQGSSFPLTDSAKVDKSIIYYDSDAGSYKADSTWTTTTLTDGGNF